MAPVFPDAAPRRPVTVSLILLLGLITAFDAMAIDIYLPAFPALAEHFSVPAARVQITLGTFLLGLAIGQALFGPLLDRFGRRRPLLGGIALFTAGSALAALSTSLEMLVVARFIQALGAAAALVAPRAMVSDLCDERASARIYSILMQVVAIVPLLAPLLGSFILARLGWQAIFWSLAIAALLALGLSLVFLKETLPPGLRTGTGLRRSFIAYGELLRHRGYLRDCLVGGMTMAALFAYISGSPFAVAAAYGVSPATYSLLFAAGGLTMILAAQANILVLRWLSVRTVVRAALVALLAASLLLLAAGWAGAGLPVYAGLLGVAIASLSLLFGNNAAEVMAHMPDKAGSASALLGVVQYACGAVAGALSAALWPDARVSVALLLAVVAAAALGLDMTGRRRLVAAPQTGRVNS